MRAIMSLSGGMDSTCLLLRLLKEGYRVTCVSYEYGQKHRIEIDKAVSNVEYLSSKGHEIDHKVIDLTSAMAAFRSALTDSEINVPEGFYEKEQMKSTFVPNRNAIFSSILYGTALSIATEENTDVKISLGVHSGDHAIYPDCRPDFYEALERAFKLGNWNSEKISFELPYIDGDKVTILRDAMLSCKKLNLDFDLILKNTITSYNPNPQGISSGKSGSDVERILAFHEIGRKDPITYALPWEDVLKNALEEKLRHHVMKENGTEMAFSGRYDKHFKIGIYKCAECGMTLFESDSKFDSGCGWPAFRSEEQNANIIKLEDRSYGMIRTEVRCSGCDSHLGHLFKEYSGPRYCINSICLEFEGE
tara:strand:+ start:9043 stop:10131 length:1089 start_codon:yes stop_codon:yes gene_type:complete